MKRRKISRNSGRLLTAGAGLSLPIIPTTLAVTLPRRSPGQRVLHIFCGTIGSLVVALCAVVVLLGACAGGSSPLAESSAQTSGAPLASDAPQTSDDAQTSDAPAAESSPQASDEPPTSGEPQTSSTVSPEAEDGSPLGALLGLPLADEEAMNEFLEDFSRGAEVRVAECMLRQGFEYQVSYFDSDNDVGNRIDFDSREYAVEYGFGVTTDAYGDASVTADPFQDPNRAYVDTLSSAELEAYQLALEGDWSESGDVDDVFEPGGCQQEGYAELYSFNVIYEQFGDEYDAIFVAIAADPRIVDARATWSTCMAEAGYLYSDIEDAQEAIRSRYHAIGSDLDIGDFDDDVQDPETPSFGTEFQAEIEELQIEERAVATASWDCNGPLREIEADVLREYEQRFVDQNGAAINEALGR